MNSQSFVARNAEEMIALGERIAKMKAVPHQRVNSMIDKFEAVAGQYAGKVRFLKVFRQGNRELAEKLGQTIALLDAEAARKAEAEARFAKLRPIVSPEPAAAPAPKPSA